MKSSMKSKYIINLEIHIINSDYMKEFDLLVSKGNIGFYKSCEVIEMYLYDNNTGNDYNLFTILVFKENYHTPDRNVTPKLIKVPNDFRIGIKQYSLTLDMAKENYMKLIEGKWKSTHNPNDMSDTDYSNLKKLNKQYVPYACNIRLNKILKNNFFNGSYILEFFDEKKNFNCLFKNEEKFKDICGQIKEITNIDLYSTKDRIGNFIFQFPINILNTHQHFDINQNTINLEFTWHDKLTTPPDCFIQIESTIDNNCVEYQILDYNKKEKEYIHIYDYIPFAIRIFRKDIDLLLYYTMQNSLKTVIPPPDTYNLKTRKFKVDDNDYEIPLLKSIKASRKNYISHIENSVNYEESKVLEKKLILKKYPIKKQDPEENPISDIRTLIERYGSLGTYIWDPFIRCNDVLNTLFHSPWHNANLRALGTPNHKTAEILELAYLNETNGSETNFDENLTLHRFELKKEFENIQSNFEGLCFEYRADTEGNSHDRFLIFPGDLAKHIEPHVYSLGISVNQYGKKHHILQKVEYPQQIVDEFEKKWKKGVTIWKYPK